MKSVIKTIIKTQAGQHEAENIKNNSQTLEDRWGKDELETVSESDNNDALESMWSIDLKVKKNYSGSTATTANEDMESKNYHRQQRDTPNRMSLE